MNGFLQYASLLVHLLVRVCFPGIDVVDIVRGQVTLQSRNTASVYMQLLQDTIVVASEVHTGDLYNCINLT